MAEDDETKNKNRRHLIWKDYSYWELFFIPELQREFDEMLASRPIWPSRIFIVLSVLFIAGAAFLAFYLE